MTSGALEISWAGETLTLLPERALWWQREATLFIADPHFGKAATFRHAGIPVPETSHADDLNRLEKLLHRHQPARLVILGDFFHARTGRSEATLSALSEWRARWAALKILLVLGNHDRHAGSPPPEWQIECVEEPWLLPPFTCHHHPPEKITRGFALAGHVHPAFRLSERSGLSATGVCFHFSPRLALLPAFGHFTGTHAIKPVAGDRVFLVGKEQVLDVSRLIQ